MTNIRSVPTKDKPPELLIGPFETWRVMVDGRIIPRLTGYREDDRIWLVVDGRFGASFAEADAHGAAHLIANALAIGEGYAWLGATSKERPFAPLGHAIGEPERDTPPP